MWHRMMGRTLGDLDKLFNVSVSFLIVKIRGLDLGILWSFSAPTCSGYLCQTLTNVKSAMEEK